MIEKNLRKNFIINTLLVLSIFLLDRFSKIYVIYLEKKFLGSDIFSSKFLNITLIWNEGIAFGLFSFNEKIFYNILTSLTEAPEVASSEMQFLISLTFMSVIFIGLSSILQMYLLHWV